MKKYPTPKPFNPSSEDMKRVAEEISKYFNNDKVLVTQDGQRIRGKKSKKQ